MGEGEEIVERYREVREISRAYADSLMDDVPRRAIKEYGKRLGLWKEGKLLLREDHELTILYDYCIYDWREEGSSIIERRLDSAPPPALDSDQYTVLQAMAGSTYGLVQARKIIEGLGILGYDFLHLRPWTVADIGLSRTGVKNMVLATRVIPFDEFVMTSGVPLTVDRETLRGIEALLRNRFRGGEEWFMDVDDSEQSEIIGSIIRLLLQSGASSRVKYESHYREDHDKALGEGRSAGRNDPCPCGSGRKYKHCCGGRSR